MSQSRKTISTVRRERERAEMCEKIMDAAREMFVSDGYEAVTLRKVAAAIEYAPATIYQYFKDKESLVRAIIDADSEDLRKNLLGFVDVEDPIERLNEMARRYVQWGISYPNHYLLMLVPPPAWARQQDLAYEERPNLALEALVVLNAVVREAMTLGIVKEKYSNSSQIAAALWAGIHGTVLLEITMNPNQRRLLGDEDPTFEKRFATIMEAFRDAFLKDPGERTQ